MHYERRTIGSLFAGIGGFDLGFERAGYSTRWQVELDPINRAVLAGRFPGAQRFQDVRAVGPRELSTVEVITAGFPCQDISNSGNSKRGGREGIAGKRSGLFSEVMRLTAALRPRWLVLENVEALLTINAGQDFAVVIQALRECGYVGCWRVLDAQHFGVPQRRRRLFVVAGDREQPPADLLADAAPVGTVSSAVPPGTIARPAHQQPGYTLQADNSPCRLTMGGELLITEQDGWGKMVERARAHELHGLPAGMDDASTGAAYAAGNAVVPQVAEWLARKLINA